MAGFLTIGILTDLIGRGKYLYSVLFWFHNFNILVVVAFLVAYCVKNNNNDSFFTSSLFDLITGWLVTVNFVLLFNVQPLYIASKMREK